RLPAAAGLAATAAAAPPPRAPSRRLLLQEAEESCGQRQRQEDAQRNLGGARAAKGDAAQQVTLRAQEVFSHPRGAPGGGDPYQIRRRLQAVSGGVQLIAIWTHTRNF
ncbi:PTPRE isoform 8, partial [Pan troglodytes]